MMSKVDMGYIDYRYTGFAQVTSRKSPAGDLFREIIVALGANSDLLKEGHDPNRRYSFDEDCTDLILDMLEMAKTKGGKRLRCWDYQEAGTGLIAFYINAFRYLYQRNGISEQALSDVTLQMLAQTEFVLVTSEIPLELYGKIKASIFAPNDKFPEEDDNLSASDQFVFLRHLSNYPEMPWKVALGHYWFFCEDCKMRSQRIPPELKEMLHNQTPEEREEFKEHLLKRLHFDNALEEDDTASEAITRLAEIHSGKCRLGAKKEIRPLFESLSNRMEYHAKQIGLSMDNEGTNLQRPPRKVSPKISTELVAQSQALFDASLCHYYGLKAHRSRESSTPQNTLIEMSFESRFGFPMFEN